MKRKPRTVSIPRAHLREDIREAQKMIRELQGGVKRDKRALRMSGYGGVPPVCKKNSPPLKRMVRKMVRLYRAAIVTKNQRAYDKKINTLYDLHDAIKATCGKQVAKGALAQVHRVHWRKA